MERALVYGDLLFESMRFEAGQICHFNYHIERLFAGAKLLQFEWPNNLNEASVLQEVLKSITDNYKIYKVRLVLYRNAQGFYLPNQHLTKWDVEVFPLILNSIQSPLKMGIYKVIQKPMNVLSTFKTGNALLYVMAAIWAKENGFDDAFILNEQGRVCEATSSNVFWFDGATWFTPPITEACVAGIGRRVFMERELVIEKPCQIEELKMAQKIILSNAINLQTEVVLK